MDQPKFLDWILPEKLDFTTDDRFLSAKFPSKTLMNPSTNYYQSECQVYGLNWVLIWCISMVACDNFFVTELAVKKNFFGLLNVDKSPQIFRTYDEGIRAGVQTIAALLGLPMSREIIWDGTKRIIEAKATPFKELKDFDTVYGEGFSVKVLTVYEELCAFAKGEAVDPDPVVISPPDAPAPKPLPPEPVEKPKPPADPNAKKWYSWILPILKIVAGIGGPLLFILGMFFPEAVPFLQPVIVIVRAILEAIQKNGTNLIQSSQHLLQSHQ